MRHRLRLSLAFSMSTLVTAASLRACPAYAQEAEAPACDIFGRAVLPDEAPEGVDAQGITFEHAVGKLLELPPSEPMPRPDNWDTMTGEEKREWMQAWQNSPDAAAYWARAQERLEHRLAFEVEVRDDGSFTVEGVPPGRYNLHLAIPGEGAQGEDRYEDCRAHHFSRITVPVDGRVSLDAGDRLLELANAVTIGSVAPDFSVPGLDGETLTLSDFRGRYVLLDFWATWCAPCCAETPNILAAYHAFADRGFTVIALSLDNTPDLPAAYVEEHELPYEQGFLGPWSEAELTTRYGVRGIPHILLIGPDGTVLAKRLRGERLHQAIEEAMTPPTAPSP